VVKPPRLTDGNAKGKVRAGTEIKVGMMSSVPREDLAAFMLDQIGRSEFVRKCVFVKA
jgi:hypothetical protein